MNDWRVVCVQEEHTLSDLDGNADPGLHGYGVVTLVEEVEEGGLKIKSRIPRCSTR